MNADTEEAIRDRAVRLFKFLRDLSQLRTDARPELRLERAVLSYLADGPTHAVKACLRAATPVPR